MKMVVVVLLVVVCSLLAGQVGTASAVGADETGTGFSEVGTKIVNTGRNVWIPVAVLLGVIGLATAILIGMRASGFAFRTCLACAIFVVAITGAGLQTLFPGLVVSLTLP